MSQVTYKVGEVANGHRWSGSSWVPVGSGGVAAPPPEPLAARLRTFARDLGPGTWSDLLNRLAEAIDRDQDLHLWAGIDLYTMFGDAADLVPPPRQSRWRGWAIAAPAILVFLPLVATWTSLALATGAYRQALASDPTLVGRSFLEMWQTGMAGQLSPWFVFDRAAMITLASLVVLVASVVLAAVCRQRRDDQIERFDLAMNQRLHALLAESSLVIAERKLTAPDRLTKELNRAASEMRELQAKTKDLQSVAAASITAVQGSLDDAVKASGELGTAVGLANQACAQIASQQADISTLLRELDQRVSAAVSGGVSAGLVPIAAAVAGLSQTESEFSTSAAQLTAGLQGQVSGLEATVDLMAQISGRFDHLRTSLDHLAHELAAARLSESRS